MPNMFVLISYISGKLVHLIFSELLLQRGIIDDNHREVSLFLLRCDCTIRAVNCECLIITGRL